MRILRVDMPKDPSFGDGLGPIAMDRLGQFVVIAGRNGSGKSRLLQRLKTLGNNENFGRPHTEWELSEARRPFYIIDFVPRSTVITDPFDASPSNLQKMAESTHAMGILGMHAAFAKIQYAQNTWWEATHQSSTHPSDAKEKAIAEYVQLRGVLEKVLGTQLTRSPDGQAQMFGFNLGQSALSEGQRVLVQLCVAIHSQSHNLGEWILFMDEPENYVYPSAILDTIEAIQKHIPKGQIWIATHSVPLLAYFPQEAIWWMENGEISYAGNVPQRVLRGLLGDEDRLSKLSDFLTLPASLATVRFAHQCLLPPTTVEAKIQDPQLKQIREAVSATTREAKRRILDYGAGKGRLASAFGDVQPSEKESIVDWLDYVAFDGDQKDRSPCQDAIAKLYGSADGRYFNDWNELASKFDSASFDAVVMCNVLHEIDPAEWLSLFSIPSGITALLKKEGFLILVEDMQIPIGEKPHQKGFIVLDTIQIKTLFKVKESDTRFSVKTDGDGRLKTHLIPKECLTRLDCASRIEALRGLCELAKDRIRHLRGQEATYQNGRKHGFWLQQFANSQLALDQLGR